MSRRRGAGRRAQALPSPGRRCGSARSPSRSSRRARRRRRASRRRRRVRSRRAARSRSRRSSAASEPGPCARRARPPGRSGPAWTAPRYRRPAPCGGGSGTPCRRAPPRPPARRRRSGPTCRANSCARWRPAPHRALPGCSRCRRARRRPPAGTRAGAARGRPRRFGTAAPACSAGTAAGDRRSRTSASRRGSAPPARCVTGFVSRVAGGGGGVGGASVGTNSTVEEPRMSPDLPWT